ncbi:hypothetical protein [Luteolibacter soli]|uniref:Uncharacterized protein n=1 Tax=Luteolibacter soli TaxID=3135280 RepID=A0ABU9AN15_9BACT
MFIGIIACPAPGAPSSRTVVMSELTGHERYLEEWYDLSTVCQLMSQHQAVFWGCPQETFSVLVSDERHPDFDSYPRSFSARFDSPGKVCLTSAGNLRMALDSPEMWSHPVITSGHSYDDSLFELAAGSYVVTVTQMFRWKSAQFALLRPGAIHYHVHFRLATDEGGPTIPGIPWFEVPTPG